MFLVKIKNIKIVLEYLSMDMGDNYDFGIFY
jgi:hypothetical protein